MVYLKKKGMRGMGMLSFLQKLGKSFMLPIAVLPAVGIILALGREDVFNMPAKMIVIMAVKIGTSRLPLKNPRYSGSLVSLKRL